MTIVSAPPSAPHAKSRSRRTLWESHALPADLAPCANAQDWDCVAFARRLTETHGVVVAYRGGGQPWVCEDCAAGMVGQRAVPSGFFCYKGRKGLVEHLRVAHGVEVY